MYVDILYICQEDGYTTTESWASYNGTIKVRSVVYGGPLLLLISLSLQEDLVSFTACLRLQLFYERPRAYIFSYAFE